MKSRSNFTGYQLTNQWSNKLPKKLLVMIGVLALLIFAPLGFAGVTVERQTTLTDDNGGKAVTIGQGEFERPGSEFNVSATFTNFQPESDAPKINGQISAVSSVAGDTGIFTRRVSRTTVFNGEINLTNLPRGEDDVVLEFVDLSVVDQRARNQNNQGFGQNNGNQGKWSGTVVINGNIFTPQELPQPARELMRHIIGILRH